MRRPDGANDEGNYRSRDETSERGKSFDQRPDEENQCLDEGNHLMQGLDEGNHLMQRSDEGNRLMQCPDEGNHLMQCPDEGNHFMASERDH